MLKQGDARGLVMAALTLFTTTLVSLDAPVVAASPEGAAQVVSADVGFEVKDLALERGISLAEAEERLSWQDAFPALADDVASRLGDPFGGVWIDPNDGDRLKVAVARNGVARDYEVVAAAAEEHGLSEVVDVVSVTYSQAELLAVLDDLVARVTAIHQTAISTSSLETAASLAVTVGWEPDLNAVILSLPPSAEAAPSADVASLLNHAQTFGDGVQVTYDAAQAQFAACAYPYCDPPLRAGIRIRGNRGMQCTGSFLARSRSDNKLYQFTAGHCVDAFGDTRWSTCVASSIPEDDFCPGNRIAAAIGNVHNFQWGNGGGDMAILRVENPTRWRARAWVFVTAGPDSTRDESYNISSDGTSGAILHQRICTSGAFFGRTDCGEVERLDQTFSGCIGGKCRTVTRLGLASFCAIPGDSGAPVYARHTAYGLVSARGAAVNGECRSYYQGIRSAENAMNVNVSHES